MVKRLRILFCMMAVAVMSTAMAFAGDVTPIPTPVYDYSTVLNGMGNGMTSMAQSIVSAILPVVLAGLVIFGLVIAVRVGISIFRRLTGRA